MNEVLRSIDSRKKASQQYWNNSRIVDEFSNSIPPDYWYEYFNNERKSEKISVLDLGCGGGRNTKMLVELGYTVYACDLHDNMIKATNQKFSDQDKAPISILRADIISLPYLDQWFDVILSSGVYHNVHSKNEFELAIQESSRVLKFDGELAINMFCDAHIDNNLTELDEEALYMTPDNIDLLLISSNTIIDVLNKNGLSTRKFQIYKTKINCGVRSVFRGIFIKNK